MIVSINDVNDINSENVEKVLEKIVHPQSIKITALSPITYLNLNTDENVLRGLYLNEPTNVKKHIVASKSTNVVKGDRVKFSDMSQLVDESFIYAMILSLEPDKLKQKNEKVYVSL